MKLIIKFFCFVLALGFAGLFVLKRPDGSPWLTVRSFVPDVSLGSLKRSVTDVLPEQVMSGDGEQIAVYKWRSDDGSWQFSDKRPEDRPADQVMVSTHLNRDLAPKAKEAVAVAEPVPEKGNVQLIKDSSGFSPTTIAPDKISKLIDDAKNVQKLMDDRQRQLDNSLQ